MAYETLVIEHEEPVLIIRLNRPDALNALNNKLLEELSIVMEDADNNQSIRVIILTGSENKAFVAGADIKEFVDYNPKQGEALARKGQEMLFDLLDNLKTPSIAAINGFALGGGLELAMASHIRIASDNAKMGLPEVSLGVIPGYGGTQRLAQLVGKGKAIEMIITGNMISANEAKEIGLVNYVCKQDELIIIAEKIASKIKGNSPMAIGNAIKSINASFNNGINGFETEKKEFGSCFGTPEFKEGTKAFMEKRKPNF